jgi:hypothetical protein
VTPARPRIPCPGTPSDGRSTKAGGFVFHAGVDAAFTLRCRDPWHKTRGLAAENMLRTVRGLRCHANAGRPGSGFFLIERDTDPTRLSPDNATMMIAVHCIDNQVE